MSLMQKLKASNHKNVSGVDNDVLGGSGNRRLETDIYLFTIKAAYMIESKNGAVGLSLRLETDQGQFLNLEGAMGSIYLTNRNQEPFYIDKKTEEKKFLPGFLMADSLSLLVAGCEFGDLDAEEKIIGVYDPEAGKEVPTKVPMLMELVNKQFYGAVELQLHDKTEKDNKGDYVPTGETFEKNELVKVFRERDRLTRSEIELDEEIAEEDTFYSRWLEKNKGEVRDRTQKDGARSGTPKTKIGGNKPSNQDASGDDKPKKKNLFS